MTTAASAVIKVPIGGLTQLTQRGRYRGDEVNGAGIPWGQGLTISMVGRVMCI